VREAHGEGAVADRSRDPLGGLRPNVAGDEDARYYLVFFAARLSHVPPQRFDALWAFVADCLTPGGRVFVIDELPAVAARERPAGGWPAPTVRRRLTTGESYRAVKVLYEPDELRARLAALGWDAQVHAVGWRFFYATGRRR
jgi:hypothetical protein